MIKIFMIYIFSILIPILSWGAQDNPSRPSVIFIDKNNNERLTDWEIKTFPIWRIENNEKNLYLQVWIALPPLLAMVSQNQGESGVQIIDNLVINKSPFAKKNEFKKVLLFETQNSVSVFALKKHSIETDKSNDLIKIKVLFPDDFTMIKHSPDCKKLGYSVFPENKDKAPFLMSIDCVTQLTTVISIKSSSDFNLTVNNEESLGFIFDNKGQNVKINISQPIIGNSKVRKIGSIKGIKKNDENIFHVIYKKSDNKTEIFNASLKKNNTQDDESTSLQLYNLGLLASKTGLELLFFINYKLNHWDSYFQGKIFTPLEYFNNQQKNQIYFDASLSYLKSIRIYQKETIFLGTGIKMFRYSSPINSLSEKQSLLTPQFIVQFNELSIFKNKYPLNFSLEYSPFLQNISSDHSTGGRFVADLSLGHLETDSGVFSLNFVYSSVRLKNNLNFMKDDKFLGGVNFQW